MPSPLNAELSDALALRLKLQISLSLLPVVDEWMDTELCRWLESVPMPPEMAGHLPPAFLVTVACDRSRLRWSAHGHPAGFVPKMAEYLSKCGVRPEEVDVLNQVGDELSPELVGTWVGVESEKLVTGWHFLDERPMGVLAGLLHSGAAGVSLLEWASAVGVSAFRRYSRAIGDRSDLEVEVAIPGPSLADRLDTAASAFSGFGAGKLPGSAHEAAEASPGGELALVVRLAAGRIDRVGLIISQPAGDAVAGLCREAGLPLDPEIARIAAALSAGDPGAVELSVAGGKPAVDLHLVPAGGGAPAVPA